MSNNVIICIGLGICLFIVICELLKLLLVMLLIKLYEEEEEEEDE